MPIGNKGVGGDTAEVAFSRRLMAYRSPHSPTAQVGEVFLLRGAIVSAFGHVDQLLVKVATRAARVDVYAFRPKPPTRTEERLEYLRAVAEVDGPLSPHKGLLLAVLKRMEELNGFRTQLAHASYMALGRGTVSFPETIKVRGKREMETRHNSTTIDALRRTALRYAIFGRLCERLYYRLCEARLLPEVAFHGGWHSRLSPAWEPRTLAWTDEVDGG